MVAEKCKCKMTRLKFQQVESRFKVQLSKPKKLHVIEC